MPEPAIYPKTIYVVARAPLSTEEFFEGHRTEPEILDEVRDGNEKQYAIYTLKEIVQGDVKFVERGRTQP